MPIATPAEMAEELFRRLLSAHVNRICSLGRKFLRGVVSERERDLLFNAEEVCWLDTVSALKPELPPHDVAFPEELSDADRRRYDTQKGCAFCGVLRYRGAEVPLYDDDAGQQVFAVLDGETIGGGSFNLFYCDEFERAVDLRLDRAILMAESKGEAEPQGV